MTWIEFRAKEFEKLNEDESTAKLKYKSKMRRVSKAWKVRRVQRDRSDVVRRRRRGISLWYARSWLMACQDSEENPKNQLESGDEPATEDEAEPVQTKKAKK